MTLAGLAPWRFIERMLLGGPVASGGGWFFGVDFPLWFPMILTIGILVWRRARLKRGIPEGFEVMSVATGAREQASAG
jgi:hypothetical protein